MAIENVTLNIYDLVPQQQQQQASDSTSSSSSQQPQQTSRLSNFFSGVLTPLGFGAYHTSIDVRGYRYQFGAQVGITRTSSTLAADSQRFVPSNAAYRESVVLGQTWAEQGEINAVIQRMRDGQFRGENYHMANRNCNHFAETFATALVVGSELLEEGGNRKLDKFPAWVNRLARTGTSLGIDDGNACDVLEEARAAAGLEGKVGWDLMSSASATAKKGGLTGASTSAKRSQKKELTEKQKAALAKLKKAPK
ncbi:hypothetical protein ACHAWF_002695 [Thalassiosira exigua]